MECKECNLKLGHRNKTGFCTSHRGLWVKKCTSCPADINIVSKSGLCKDCYSSNHYSNNKVKINKHYNDIYHANKKEINEKRAIREKWRWHNDPLFKLKKMMRSRFKKAMRENWVTGSFTKLLGCTIKDLKQHIETQFHIHPDTKEVMTWDNYGTLWQIDHKIAFCAVDLTIQEELAKVSNYINLQPLWDSEHNVKTTLDRKNKHVNI